MQSVRDEVWGPVRQRGEQHACVRLVTNLQVPVPPVHALPLRSRRPAPRALALTNLRLCSQARLGLAHRSHAHTQPPLPLTHCEQGSGEWTAPDKTPPRRRQHSSLVFTFVLVLVASCLLVAWSLYAWHMHEDKQRLEQSNRRLALRLKEAEDDIRKLQELTLKLNAHPPPAPHDADAAKPLPPAPPGPEPQQPDTQILRGERPGDRGGAHAGEGAGLTRQGWTADNPDIAGVRESGAVGKLWYVGRDEAWYIVDRVSHQRLLHAAALFLGPSEGKAGGRAGGVRAGGEAEGVAAGAANVVELATNDAVNTLDHIARALHDLAAQHARGMGIADESLQGGVRDVVARVVVSPLVRTVCSVRYGIGLAAASALLLNPEADVVVFDSERQAHHAATQQLLHALFPGRLTVAAAAARGGGSSRPAKQRCDVIVCEDFSARGLEELRALRPMAKRGRSGEGGLVVGTFPQAGAWLALKLPSPQVRTRAHTHTHRRRVGVPL